MRAIQYWTIVVSGPVGGCFDADLSVIAAASVIWRDGCVARS